MARISREELNRRSRERMAEKRNIDPEFAERQRQAKRDWYKKNALTYKQQVNNWRNNNRHRLRIYTRKSKYGLTQEQYEIMFAAQGSRCAICRSDKSGWKFGWHIDHDHSCCSGQKVCGKCIRGILCQACNHLLARSNEDILTLIRAIEYLQTKSLDLKCPAIS